MCLFPQSFFSNWRLREVDEDLRLLQTAWRSVSPAVLKVMYICRARLSGVYCNKIRLSGDYRSIKLMPLRLALRSNDVVGITLGTNVLKVFL